MKFCEQHLSSHFAYSHIDPLRFRFLLYLREKHLLSRHSSKQIWTSMTALLERSRFVVSPRPSSVRPVSPVSYRQFDHKLTICDPVHQSATECRLTSAEKGKAPITGRQHMMTRNDLHSSSRFCYTLSRLHQNSEFRPQMVGSERKAQELELT